MAFAGKVWRLLVGIKDGLSLVFLLLFFGLLFAVLTARPGPAQIRSSGALLLELDGVIVEEASPIDPIAALLSGSDQVGEYEAGSLIRALDAAAQDDRINSVVLDLSGLLGGGQVHLQAIGEALDRVKAADKPVFSYAIAYGDDGMMLASHATEVWVDPQGGAFVAGPGGSNLYYGELLENLNINARIYKVGTYKSAVEPFSRNSMSPEARENAEALYGALWSQWQAHVAKARPKAQIARVTQNPVEWIQGSQGDLAKAALAAGLVDKLGSRAEFGDRVAMVAGDDEWDDLPGAYAATDLEPWLADNLADVTGSAIGVITIAGEIVDGDAGPGLAGGERIADLLDAALEDDFKALVVRVDSPGGSVLASEEIRQAILRHKAKGIPIVVSMANVAASGGYWVATPADRIFAEPETITGSIGIFAVIPTFERAAAEWGVGTDGVRTTALSGQPDLIGGFTPEIDAILQASVENGYDQFLTRVAQSRKLTKAKVDELGQGRVWDGGAARQLGLVDQFGGLDDALAWAADKADLADGEWHAAFLGSEQSEYDTLLASLLEAKVTTRPHGGDIFAMVAKQQQAIFAQAHHDLKKLMTVRGAQAYCLACPVEPRLRAQSGNQAGTLTILAHYLRE